MEGSHSGLVHHLGKMAHLNGCREFESRPLRQPKKPDKIKTLSNRMCVTTENLVKSFYEI